MEAVWRVFSDEFEVHSFIERHGLSPTAIHEKGRSSGVTQRTAERSGFTLGIPISAGVEKRHFVSAISSFIAVKEEAFAELADAGIRSQIDIAVFVGGEDSFTASVVLSPDEMRDFAKAGVEVCVSAYPCSGE